MTPYLPILKKSPLFDGFDEASIGSILPCLSASVRQADKNTFVLSAGETLSDVGLILSGSLHVVSEDYWGRKDILSNLGPGELFAESFSCAHAKQLPVSVVAAEDTAYMRIDCGKIIRTCSSACVFHTQLINNLLQILARKNIRLTQKITQLSKRTTREKLLAYLSDEAQRASGASFEIPFSRQELADYLSVDRSAMTTELGKMRDKGLLEFERRHFTLHAEDFTSVL